MFNVFCKYMPCWRSCKNSCVSLVQFFDVVDADHSGEIDVHELQRALALGDLNFSLSIVAHMIRRAGNTSFSGNKAEPCST